jgi:ubiquinone/menaquinone biosynthesis C-methylase UbiE
MCCAMRNAAWIGLALLVFGGLPLAPARAQDKSLQPGINKPYENPNLPDAIKRFERDNREIYQHRQEIAAACQLKPGMNVADVGAGTGLFTRIFAAQVAPQGRVYAVDIARKFIEHIEKTCQAAQLVNVTGVVCKPDSVELPLASVDLAFLCDTYHHFEFPQKSLASIHRALRPGGRLVLIDYRRIEGQTPAWLLKHMRAGQEVFTREIEAAGFKKLDEINLLKENYLVRFERVGS